MELRTGGAGNPFIALLVLFDLLLGDIRLAQSSRYSEQ
jgi:hypothetical protein